MESFITQHYSAFLKFVFRIFFKTQIVFSPLITKVTAYILEIRERRRKLKPPIIWSLTGNHSKHCKVIPYVNVCGGMFLCVSYIILQGWFCI